MSYGIMFWGNLSNSSVIFRLQKRQLELWKDVRTVSCRNLFKKLEILTLISQYILSLLMYVVQNMYTMNPYGTRRGIAPHILNHNTSWR